MSGDLITWLRAQLDARERLVRRDPPHQSGCGSIPPPEGYNGPFPCDCGEPHLQLAEIDAKRQLLDEAERSHGRDLAPGVYDGRDPDEVERDEAVHDAMGEVVRLLALPFAGRDGYREEWRP